MAHPLQEVADLGRDLKDVILTARKTYNRINNSKQHYNRLEKQYGMLSKAFDPSRNVLTKAHLEYYGANDTIVLSPSDTYGIVRPLNPSDVLNVKDGYIVDDGAEPYLLVATGPNVQSIKINRGLPEKISVLILGYHSINMEYSGVLQDFIRTTTLHYEFQDKRLADSANTLMQKVNDAAVYAGYQVATPDLFIANHIVTTNSGFALTMDLVNELKTGVYADELYVMSPHDRYFRHHTISCRESTTAVTTIDRMEEMGKYFLDGFTQAQNGPYAIHAWTSGKPWLVINTTLVNHLRSLLKMYNEKRAEIRGNNNGNDVKNNCLADINTLRQELFRSENWRNTSGESLVSVVNALASARATVGNNCGGLLPVDDPYNSLSPNLTGDAILYAGDVDALKKGRIQKLIVIPSDGYGVLSVPEIWTSENVPEKIKTNNWTDVPFFQMNASPVISGDRGAKWLKITPLSAHVIMSLLRPSAASIFNAIEM